MKVEITRIRRISRLMLRLCYISFSALIVFLFLPILPNSSIVNLVCGVAIISIIVALATQSPRQLGDMVFHANGFTLIHDNQHIETFYLDQIDDLKVTAYYYRGKLIGIVRFLPDDGAYNEISFRKDKRKYKFNFTLESKQQLLWVKSLVQSWRDLKPEIEIIQLKP